MKLPRSKPDFIIEELRDQARESLAEVFPDIMDIEEIFEWEIADTVEKFWTALKLIAEGVENPQDVAAEALKLPVFVPD